MILAWEQHPRGRHDARREHSHGGCAAELRGHLATHVRRHCRVKRRARLELLHPRRKQLGGRLRLVLRALRGLRRVLLMLLRLVLLRLVQLGPLRRGLMLRWSLLLQRLQRLRHRAAVGLFLTQQGHEERIVGQRDSWRFAWLQSWRRCMELRARPRL